MTHPFVKKMEVLTGNGTSIIAFFC